ncbi:MAG: nucleotide exchange factor GrpE [Candidatus Doudnabacteria bacterium]|nr:nucleotide exchange factor GrpE [Candidatus Doudnabacteria bacterium]
MRFFTAFRMTNTNMSDENNQTQEATVEELQAKNEEFLNNWKRVAADLENFRKRREAENKELLEFAKEMAAIKLLPSLQSLEQVLKFAPNDEKYKGWLDGLKATILQLEKAMEELGLKKINTVGENFDHELHEAVEEAEGEDGKVLKELQPGFMLHNKVIIPAKVVVGKKLSDSNIAN